MRRLLALLAVAAPLYAGEPGAEIARLIADVQAAEAQHDPTALADRFDAEAFVAEAVAAGFLGEADAARMVSLVRARLPELMAAAAFAGARVRRIQVEEDRAVAVLDHRLANGEPVRLRWFLRRTPDGWRFYDGESPDLGLRMSGALGIGFVAAHEGPPGWVDAARSVVSTRPLLDEGRWEEAKALLDAAAGAGLPAVVEACRLEALAIALHGLGEGEAALEACAAARELQSDLPLAYLVEASILNDLDRHEDALAAARKYIEAVGETGDSCVQLGDALLALGRKKEAAVAYRAGLAEDPEYAGNVLGLALALPEDGKSAVAAPFRRLPDPVASFRWMADNLAAWEEWAALRALVAVFRESHPEHPWADYGGAQVLLAEDRPEAAAALARSALDRLADADDRHEVQEFWLVCMLETGQPVAALAGAPDRRAAFDYLAWRLAEDGRPEDLARVIAARAQDADAGAAVALWRIELEWMGGRHAEVCDLASRHADAIRELDDEEGWRLADRWIRSLVRLGRNEEALKEARSVALEDGNSFYLVLAYAASGQPDEAVRGFERCLEEGDEAADLYGDEDLGPLLKGEAYRMLRLKYPPGE